MQRAVCLRCSCRMLNELKFIRYERNIIWKQATKSGTVETRKGGSHARQALCGIWKQTSFLQQSENKQVFLQQIWKQSSHFAPIRTQTSLFSTIWKQTSLKVFLQQFDNKQVFLQQFEHKQARNRTKIFESLALNFTENRQTQLTWPRLAFLVISCSLRINKHRITTVCTFSLRFEGKKCPTFNKKTSLYSFIFLAVTSPAWPDVWKSEKHLPPTTTDRFQRSLVRLFTWSRNLSGEVILRSTGYVAHATEAGKRGSNPGWVKPKIWK